MKDGKISMLMYKVYITDSFIKKQETDFLEIFLNFLEEVLSKVFVSGGFGTIHRQVLQKTPALKESLFHKFAL